MFSPVQDFTNLYHALNDVGDYEQESACKDPLCRAPSMVTERFLPFLARDSIYAIAHYMPSPVRLSVCPSVCHTGGSVKDG